jgi:hypothetical protein
MSMAQVCRLVKKNVSFVLFQWTFAKTNAFTIHVRDGTIPVRSGIAFVGIVFLTSVVLFVYSLHVQRELIRTQLDRKGQVLSSHIYA